MLTFLARCTHVGRYATEGLERGGSCFHIFCCNVVISTALFVYMSLWTVQWRRSIGSVSSAKFLQELSRVFAERGRS